MKTSRDIVYGTKNNDAQFSVADSVQDVLSKVPVLNMYINGNIASTIESDSLILIRDYPELSTLRAKELAGARLVSDYGKDLQALRRASSARLLASAVIDQIDNARMDLEDENGGIYRIVERLTGHRSMGMDIDSMEMNRIDLLNLGAYVENWSAKQDALIASVKLASATAKQIAHDERMAERQQQEAELVSKEIERLESYLPTAQARADAEYSDMVVSAFGGKSSIMTADEQKERARVELENTQDRLDEMRARLAST